MAIGTAVLILVLLVWWYISAQERRRREEREEAEQRRRAAADYLQNQIIELNDAVGEQHSRISELYWHDIPTIWLVDLSRAAEKAKHETHQEVEKLYDEYTDLKDLDPEGMWGRWGGAPNAGPWVLANFGKLKRLEVALKNEMDSLWRDAFDKADRLRAQAESLSEEFAAFDNRHSDAWLAAQPARAVEDAHHQLGEFRKRLQKLERKTAKLDDLVNG